MTACSSAIAAQSLVVAASGFHGAFEGCLVIDCDQKQLAKNSPLEVDQIIYLLKNPWNGSASGFLIASSSC